VSELRGIGSEAPAALQPPKRSWSLASGSAEIGSTGTAALDKQSEISGGGSVTLLPCRSDDSISFC
jgi:hypothetical protein